MADWNTPPTAAEMATVKDPWAAPPTPTEMALQSPPSMAQSIAGGALRGASLGLAPKMEAGWKAIAKRLLPKSLGGTDKPMGAQYDEDLAAAQGRYAAEKAANPKAHMAAELGGALVPGAVGMLATGGAAALPMAMGEGAVSGVGYSNANSPGGYLRDAVLGAGIGGVGYGLGAGLGKAFSGVAGYAGRKVGQAQARAAGKAADEIAAELASARGALGAEVQKGSRQIENLDRLRESMTPEQLQQMGQLNVRRPVLQAALRDPETGAVYRGATHVHAFEEMPAAVQAKIGQPGTAIHEGFVTPEGQFLGRDEASAWIRQNHPNLSVRSGAIDSEELPLRPGALTELRQRVAQSTLEAVPSQVGAIGAKDAELAALKQGASQALKERTADLLSTGEMKQQIAARLLRYGPVAAGSFIGHHIGGPIGASVGMLAGAGSRPMIQSLRRMAQNPAVQNAVWGGVERQAPRAGDVLRRLLLGAAEGPITEAAVAR